MTPGPAYGYQRGRDLSSVPRAAATPGRGSRQGQAFVAQAAIDLAHQVRRGQAHAVPRERDRRGDHVGVAEDAAVAELLGRAELRVRPRRGELVAVRER